MKIKTILAALTMLISSSAAFANAPMPFDLRAGHGVVYVEWKISALPTDSVDVSTPDGTKLGVVKALPGVWRWYSPDSCPQKGVVIRLQTG